MSKYGNGITVSGACRNEIEEATDILNSYRVSTEDIDTITGMIKEAYFELSESMVSGRAMDRIIADEVGEDWLTKERFMTYMQYANEERVKYPFDVDDDEGDEE
jgi:hypothetical protein